MKVGRSHNHHIIYDYLNRINDPNIVEIGMTRNKHPLAWIHDGYFTLFISHYLQNTNKGNLLSIDIDQNALIECEDLLYSYGLSKDRLTLICDNAFNISKYISSTIDLLYLDAWDYTIDNPRSGIKKDLILNEKSEQNHLNIFILLEPYLKQDSLIIIDDVLDINNYEGKGKQLIPYMLLKGYKIYPDSLIRDPLVKERNIYQLILRRT